MKGSFMPTVAKPVKYRQIYEELSHRIRCGALKPGEQLPSTQELADYPAGDHPPDAGWLHHRDSRQGNVCFGT